MTVALVGLTRRTAKRGKAEWHVYQWNGGPEMTGVTTHIGVLNKPGVVDWMKKLTAETAVDKRLLIPEWIETGGREGAIALLAGAADKVRNDAGDLGTRVHALLEAVARGQDVTLTPEEEPFVAAFRAWCAERNPEFIATEFMVYSEKHEYGGTADVLLKLDGETWLVDYKTSGGVYPETALQLVALGRADWAGAPGNPRKFRIPKSRYGILHVRPEGVTLYEAHITDEEWEVFLACRRIYGWLRGHAKQVLKEVA